jgi:hypothetical protein
VEGRYRLEPALGWPNSDGRPEAASRGALCLLNLPGRRRALPKRGSSLSTAGACSPFPTPPPLTSTSAGLSAPGLGSDAGGCNVYRLDLPEDWTRDDPTLAEQRDALLTHTYLQKFNGVLRACRGNRPNTYSRPYNAPLARLRALALPPIVSQKGTLPLAVSYVNLLTPQTDTGHVLTNMCQRRHLEAHKCSSPVGGV